MLAEDTNRQIHRPMIGPQHDISQPSVASQVVGKRPKFSTLSGNSTQKGQVLFEQRYFEVRHVMQSHTEVTLMEGTVQSLHKAMADLV